MVFGVTDSMSESLTLEWFEYKRIFCTALVLQTSLITAIASRRKSWQTNILKKVPSHPALRASTRQIRILRPKHSGTLGQPQARCLRPYHVSVRNINDSLSPAIHTRYRISLRSSIKISVLKELYWICKRLIEARARQSCPLGGLVWRVTCTHLLLLQRPHITDADCDASTYSRRTGRAPSESRR